MNRTQLREALDVFVRGEELQTAALTGKWGVGKTHLWREYAAHLELPHGLNGTSYASLFGAGSLSELRARVTDGASLSKTRQHLLDRYREVTAKSLVLRKFPGKAAALLRRFSSTGWMDWLAETSYWFVRDMLVCLDDIERCAEDLDGSTIMGFIDELRVRGCKVVLILNRDQLTSQREKIENFWEKVVDIDLELVPSISENASIIFGQNFEPHEHAQWVQNAFESLVSANLRIHKRARWLVARLQPLIAGLNADLQRQVIEHGVLLCWALLDPAARIAPELLQSNKFGPLYLTMVDNADVRLSAEERRWAAVVEDTNFAPADYDSFLITWIRTGWCDQAALQSVFARLSGEWESERARQRLHDVFRRYQESFHLDQQGYVAHLRAVLSEELERLNVFEFDNGITSLKQNGDESRDLVDRYISCRGEHLQAVAQASERNSDPADAKLLEEIRRREMAYRQTRHSIDAVAHHLATSDSWGRDQIDFLASCDAAEFQAWILSEPAALRRKIKVLLRFRDSEEAVYRAVVERLEQALKVIAARSAFDRERIARVYGVSLA